MTYSDKNELELSEIQYFENPKLGKIRAVMHEGKGYIALTDLCFIIGIQNTSQLGSRVDENNKRKFPMLDTNNITRHLLFVDEEGFYEIIFESRKETAKELRKWVMTYVIPVMRNNEFMNSASTPRQALANAGDYLVQLNDRQIKIESQMKLYVLKITQLENKNKLYEENINKLLKRSEEILQMKNKQDKQVFKLKNNSEKNIIKSLKNDIGREINSLLKTLYVDRFGISYVEANHKARREYERDTHSQYVGANNSSLKSKSDFLAYLKSKTISTSVYLGTPIVEG